MSLSITMPASSQALPSLASNADRVRKKPWASHTHGGKGKDRAGSGQGRGRVPGAGNGQGSGRSGPLQRTDEAFPAALSFLPGRSSSTWRTVLGKGEFLIRPLSPDLGPTQIIRDDLSEILDLITAADKVTVKRSGWEGIRAWP